MGGEDKTRTKRVVKGSKVTFHILSKELKDKNLKRVQNMQVIYDLYDSEGWRIS